jgi:hypothetical protein
MTAHHLHAPREESGLEAKLTGGVQGCGEPDSSLLSTIGAMGWNSRTSAEVSHQSGSAQRANSRTRPSAPTRAAEVEARSRSAWTANPPESGSNSPETSSSFPETSSSSPETWPNPPETRVVYAKWAGEAGAGGAIPALCRCLHRTAAEAAELALALRRRPRWNEATGLVARACRASRKPYQSEPYQSEPYQSEPYQSEPYQSEPYQSARSPWQPRRPACHRACRRFPAAHRTRPLEQTLVGSAGVANPAIAEPNPATAGAKLGNGAGRSSRASSRTSPANSRRSNAHEPRTPDPTP